MRNLTLYTENQVEKDQQAYTSANGKIDINNYSHYLKHVKTIIMQEFNRQNVEFNFNDFQALHNLYTRNLLVN